jgi:hypothetical protein
MHHIEVVKLLTFWRNIVKCQMTMDYDECWTKSGHDRLTYHLPVTNWCKPQAMFQVSRRDSIQDTQNIVKWCLKARIAQPEKICFSRQLLSKHIPTPMNMHAAIEERLVTVISVWSMLKLYNEDQWDHLDAGKQIYCRLLTTQSRNTAQYY